MIHLKSLAIPSRRKATLEIITLAEEPDITKNKYLIPSPTSKGLKIFQKHLRRYVINLYNFARPIVC